MCAERVAAIVACAVILVAPSVASDAEVLEQVREVRARIETDAWLDALELARDTAGRHEGDPDADTALGEALYRAGEIEDAETVLADVVARADPPPPRALTVLGLIRAAQGRYGEGVELMTRAIDLAPRDPFVLYWGSGVQDSRSDAIATLENFLAISDGQDPDRVEGVRGTLRLYRALGDDPVWVRDEAPDRMEIPLRAIPDGRGGVSGYSIEIDPGERGRPLAVLFDTGSPALYLVEKAARKRGFEPLAEETTFGGGGDGRHNSERGRFERFRIGELSYRAALAYTTSGAVDPGRRFKGLVGVAPFAGYRVVIDLAADRLRLEQAPDEPAEGGVPYWSVSGQLLVRVTTPGGPDGLFLLDTGASRTLVDVGFARTVPGVADGGATRVRGYGGVRQGVRRAEGIDLRFEGLGNGGRPLNTADLTYRSRLCGVRISGFLGLDVLDGARIVVDTVHRRIHVEPGQGTR